MKEGAHARPRDLARRWCSLGGHSLPSVAVLAHHSDLRFISSVCRASLTFAAALNRGAEFQGKGLPSR